jgi:hypothetical protein
LWHVSQLAEAAVATSWYGVWLADLPSAGGYAPLWQLEHCAVTVTWLWFHFVGFQPVVEWQLMQLVAATGMCVVFLPVAALPLWQLLQLVATVNVLWSTLAEDQSEVDLWQVSHTVWPA